MGFRVRRWLTRHNIAPYSLFGFWAVTLGTVEMTGAHPTALQWVIRVVATIFLILAWYKIRRSLKSIRESNAAIAELERRRKLIQQQRQNYRNN